MGREGARKEGRGEQGRRQMGREEGERAEGGSEERGGREAHLLACVVIEALRAGGSTGECVCPAGFYLRDLDVSGSSDLGYTCFLCPVSTYRGRSGTAMSQCHSCGDTASCHLVILSALLADC